MRASTFPLALILLTPLFGCPPAKDDTGADPADADTDTDADTDADAYNFVGSVTVSSTFGGEVVCDASADLTGTPYTGDCEGCDFAVEIDDAITTDNSTEECGYYSTASFIEGGGYSNLIMAHADEYYSYSAYSYVDDAFFSGYSYSSYVGPYFYGMIAYAGGSYGTFTRTGDDISWTFSASGTEITTYGYTYCTDYASYSYAEEAFGGEGGESVVACDGSTTDVWTFTATGDPAFITIDTVSDDTAFDPRMWVNDGDACTVYYADDNFTCTFPPPQYTCPSIETEATEAGVTYSVYVASYGSCAGSEAGYAIKIDGAAPGSVVLANDDAVSGLEYEISVAGSGTLTLE